MISEEEKQKMRLFLWNPKPVEPKFLSTDNPPDLFKMIGIDDTFSHDYHFEYGADEAEDDEDEIAIWPERIVKSGRATIVFWEDGTKTVVKRSPDEPDNDYNAFLAALGIRVYGSNSALKRIIRDYTVVQKPKKSKAQESKGKEACDLDKPCKGSLNDLARQQYEEYLNRNPDKWKCPKCGTEYFWHDSENGRYSFCPKCQLASTDKKG